MLDATHGNKRASTQRAASTQAMEPINTLNPFTRGMAEPETTNTSFAPHNLGQAMITEKAIHLVRSEGT